MAKSLQILFDLFIYVFIATVIIIPPFKAILIVNHYLHSFTIDIHL